MTTALGIRQPMAFIRVPTAETLSIKDGIRPRLSRSGHVVAVFLLSVFCLNPLNPQVSNAEFRQWTTGRELKGWSSSGPDPRVTLADRDRDVRRPNWLSNPFLPESDHAILRRRLRNLPRRTFMALARLPILRRAKPTRTHSVRVYCSGSRTIQSLPQEIQRTERLPFQCCPRREEIQRPRWDPSAACRPGRPRTTGRDRLDRRPLPYLECSRPKRILRGPPKGQPTSEGEPQSQSERKQQEAENRLKPKAQTR